MFRHLLHLFSRRYPSQLLTANRSLLREEASAHLLASATIEAAAMLRDYPPQVEHVKKRLLFDMALENGLNGPLTIRRYQAFSLPRIWQPFSPATEIKACKGYFRYNDSDTCRHWYMNFAHHDLFTGYGHFMFAQDEIQVAEHPALACLRELMLTRTDALKPRTVENELPTPVLFSDVQRTLKIDTHSIYGARFARADEATIRESVSQFLPASRSNILAIESPVSAGNRIYSRSEIELALLTAYSGFRAIVLTSVSGDSTPQPVVLHTGNWGCGAYGGNRQLMLTIQMMAARLAGLSSVVFYCGADSVDDVATFDYALSKQFKFRPGVKIEQVVMRLVNQRFHWGTPDGN